MYDVDIENFVKMYNSKTVRRDDYKNYFSGVDNLINKSVFAKIASGTPTLSAIDSIKYEVESIIESVLGN